MELIKNVYWHDVEYNNSEVHVDNVKCQEIEAQWDDYDIIHKVDFLYVVLNKSNSVCCLRYIKKNTYNRAFCSVKFWLSPGCLFV